MLTALKIAKSGYYSGDPEKVLNAKVDHVLKILDYEKFNDDYENAYFQINKASN